MSDEKFFEYSKRVPGARDSTPGKPRSVWDKMLWEEATRKAQSASPMSWPKQSTSNGDVAFRVRDLGPARNFAKDPPAVSSSTVMGLRRPEFSPSASDSSAQARNFLAQPIDHVKMMTDTVNDAFRRISGGAPDAQYATGLSSEFAGVPKLPDFSKGQWQLAYSTHSAAAYEHPLPGSSGMALKVYVNDGDHGGQNTATITSPTSSMDHYIEWPEYEVGMPVNEDHARRYIEGLDSDRGQ